MLDGLLSEIQGSVTEIHKLSSRVRSLEESTLGLAAEIADLRKRVGARASRSDERLVLSAIAAWHAG
jgi:hypothetical protein